MDHLQLFWPILDTTVQGISWGLTSTFLTLLGPTGKDRIKGLVFDPRHLLAEKRKLDESDNV